MFGNGYLAQLLPCEEPAVLREDGANKNKIANPNERKKYYHWYYVGGIRFTRHGGASCIDSKATSDLGPPRTLETGQ
jgi:hypothetical protein